jgi:hypothetical protein
VILKLTKTGGMLLDVVVLFIKSRAMGKHPYGIHYLP